MELLPIRRRRSRQQRALGAVRTARSAAVTLIKARIAWLLGKRAARVAAPAIAVGTAAVIVKRRSHKDEGEPVPVTVTSVPPAPAGVR
jgi:hypothetical protein